MNKMNSIMAALFLGIALVALPGCKTAEPATASSSAVKYTCPMHPEVVMSTPGKCPICGMALVEKH